MDKYDGIINKPEMEDLFIEHGLHKYIDKWKSASGKWVYKYIKKPKITASHLADDLLDGRKHINIAESIRKREPVLGTKKKYNKKSLIYNTISKGIRQSNSKHSYTKREMARKKREFEKEYAESKKRMNKMHSDFEKEYAQVSRNIKRAK